MNTENEFKSKLEALRRKAEERLAVPGADSGPATETELRRVLHDLAVHQIELELQNEDLRDAQQQLEQSRDRFQELYHHAPVGYVVADSAGMILQANQTVAQMIGRDIASLLHRPLSDFISRDDQSLFHARYRAFYKQPAGKRMEIRLVTGADQEMHTIVQGHRIDPASHPLPGEDAPERLLITISDVTPQKKAEMAIIRAKRQWEQTFDAVPDLIALINHRSEVVRVNQALARRLGTTPQACVGKRCYELLHDSPVPPAECPHQCFLASDRTSQMEMLNPKLGGYFITTVVPFITDEGQAPWCVYIAHDVTDRKRAETELIKMRNLESIGTLAGGVAHDFNNILTALIGNIELAKLHLSAENSRGQSFMDSAMKAAFKAKDLSNRLLTFAKGGDPRIQPVMIGKLLEEAAELSLCGGNVTCDIQLPERPEPVIADEVQLKSALQNIITNAREAIPFGGKVHITTRHTHIATDNEGLLKPGRYLMIHVRDEGVGISEADLEKVFDPYFTTKQMGSQKGMGLGLAISHSIIRKHQGKITVQSTEGRGTTVTVYLPLLAQHPESVEETPSERVAGRDPGRRLLIMDDEQSIWEVMQPILQRIHCQADFAPDGDKAMDMYLQSLKNGRRYAALLLDLTIRGGMGAKAMVHRIHSLNPQAKVAVFSGYSNDPVFLDYRRYGFAGALKKPFKIDELTAFIRQLLDDPGPGSSAMDGHSQAP